MQRASKQITEQQRRRVDQAVAEAEAKTSAEIIPVVATASGRYDRAEDIIGLWFSVATVIALWLWLPRASDEPGTWSGISLPWQILILIVAMVLAFIVGAAVGSAVGWLRRLFTPRAEMRDDVAARAREAFFDNRIHHTADATGLLLYVSLYERMAAVIADQQVIDELGQSFLDELCDELTSRLRAGHPTDALCTVLSAAGQRLAAVLPRAADDVNELPDTLVVMD